MFLATAVVSGLLAAALVLSGRGKLVKDPQQMKTMSTVGFPEDKLWLLATAETAGAVGVVAGLFWWPIGIAAAAGVILYFLGAVGAHLRVRDPNFVPALLPLLAAVAALVLRALTT
jgi:uncharacterized membrane protein YphA (DoxX/SURF4 family)